MSDSEPPLSLPAELIRELASAGLNPTRAPTLEQWQTLLLRFAHRFRDQPSPLHFPTSALGHELRTPMTVVMGATELLLESNLDASQRQAAQNVHRSSQDLLQVIDKLLSDVTDTPTSTPMRALTATASAASPATRRVLLAEDNEFNRTLVERALSRLLCQIDVVESGREAVRKFRSRDYDLVLMDCHMPDLDGLEATRQIRAGEQAGRHVPIIAITAGNVPGAREDCMRSGMDDFIAKPFALAKLRRKVSQWLQAGATRHSQPPLSERPTLAVAEASAVREPPNKSMDLSRLNELADDAGSPRIVEELSLIFVQDMERRIESLREAVDVGSDRSLLAVLHSIKGACGNFGAVRMAAMAEEMEREAKRGERGSLGTGVQALAAEFVVVRGLLDAEVFGIRTLSRPDGARRAQL